MLKLPVKCMHNISLNLHSNGLGVKHVAGRPDESVNTRQGAKAPRSEAERIGRASGRPDYL